METNSASEPLRDAARAGEAAAASAPVTSRAGGTISSNRDIAVVQADYLALSNDLEQAQALASALEIQLSGKTNELARFKGIWERTQADLAKFEHDLDTMRKERHALSNELQKAYAFEHQLGKVKLANEELKARAERLEAELIRERAAHVRSCGEVEELRTAMEARSVRGGAATASDQDLRGAIDNLRRQLDRFLAASPGRGEPAAPMRSAPEHIEISFGA